MQIDFLIVGQGICGTMLSWFLHKAGKRFIVIDDERFNTASTVQKRLQKSLRLL